MNFNDTLAELYQKTKNITVYAAQAYNWSNGQNCPAIGIRSYFAGYTNNDPVVDGVSFMVCGDVFYATDGTTFQKAVDLQILNTAKKDSDIFVALRAVSGTFPVATIDLGTYRISKKSILDSNSNITMELVRG